MKTLARAVLALGVLCCTPAAAAQATHQLHVLGGLGLAAPLDVDGQNVNGSGIGAFAQAEYVYARLEWVTPRAYSGLLFTSAQDDCDDGVSPCDVSAKIWFLGGKVRLLAPIPYVAPFFELGMGVSLGSLSTQVGELLDVKHTGAAYHVPFALGLALGENRDFELSLQYLFHPEQRQFGGAIAFGVSFPLSTD